MARAAAALGAWVVAIGVAASAQVSQKALSIDVIYDPVARVDFNGAPQTDITWFDNDTYLSRVRASSGRGVDWVRVDALTGRTTPLFEASRMEAALASLPGIARDEAAQLARTRDLILNPARSGALLTMGADLYFYQFQTSRAVRLTTSPAEEEEVTFSPDGRYVAFVRSNNLFVVDVGSQREQPLTTDGSNEVLNGKLDWLYQEEIWGRGRFRAYWWSPDSTHVAFLRLDERPVPKYPIVDVIPYRPTIDVTNYPKAGDPNPQVRLGVARIEGGAPAWVDLSSYSGTDLLIVDVDWHPKNVGVVYQVQDREQTWLDLNQADIRTGRSRRILRETTTAWVDRNGNPVWLKDGSFLWLSERSGFRHLYQYRFDGTQLRQITSGRWEVRPLYGVDQDTQAIYFGSGEHSPIGTDIYRIKTDGTGFTRLSKADGAHRAIFNPSFTQYADVWSDVTTPPQVRLHRADGMELRVIDGNRVPALADYRLAKPEFVQVKARDGFVMDAMMITPPDFDPSHRYPVFQHTYSGPGSPEVRNQWGGRGYLFDQLLAQQGIIVWVLDNRSASRKGVESQWPIYGRLGELELRDLEDGIAWLKTQSYVDASRILLSGTSYGGYMAAYALTHSTSWAAGIADAAVTDWRDYDTVYTERYMKLPKNNPEGYRSASPRFAADQLRGKLLIVHGTIDDNVHMQNSEQFVYELQNAGKSFELMVYPKSRHGIADPRLNKHLRQTMLDFIMRTIGQGARSSAQPSSK